MGEDTVAGVREDSYWNQKADYYALTIPYNISFRPHVRHPTLDTRGVIAEG